MKTLTRQYLDLKDRIRNASDREEIAKLEEMAEQIKKERIQQLINKIQT